MALKDGALKFVVFLGTVRDGNFGQRAAQFIVKKLEARGHQTALLGTENPIVCASTLGYYYIDVRCLTFPSLTKRQSGYLASVLYIV